MTQTSIQTHILGYPRIGERRELKQATEAFWQGKISSLELEEVGRKIRLTNWQKQKKAGIDLIPSNDFSFYDQVLDTSCLVGNIPSRFSWSGARVTLETMFQVARGIAPNPNEHADCCAHTESTYASEMTKWLDTNYHYIVPEFNAATRFQLSSSKPFDEFSEALEAGILTKPVLLGPISYLILGKVHSEENPQFDRFDLLDNLLSVYEQVLARLQKMGATWIQLDEPVLSLDLTEAQRQCLLRAYRRLSAAAPQAQLLVANYFGPLLDNLETFLQLPVAGLHFDAVRGAAELRSVASDLPPEKTISVGIVDGRNIWKNHYQRSLDLLSHVGKHVARSRLWIGSSCSLLHCPITLEHEEGLDEEIKNWLAFADQKLNEIVELRDLFTGEAEREVLERNERSHTARANSSRIHNQKVQQRIYRIREQDFRRTSSFAHRKELQQAKLQLPLLPTTTIGSFPQTSEVRAARARLRRGEWSHQQYAEYLEGEIKRCVEFQEKAGIDLLVHGEFERNDMVEYFGEQLSGFAFTRYGWVQSYGSRYVKPPIIYGDVSRPKPMTLRWSSYARSVTSRPMKGMLTGPVTIQQWSFVRDDQPRRDTALQIALAIRDEVLDLEAAGLAAIQIDEPAIREGLPLRRDDWQGYLEWAVKAFQLSSAGVKDSTQIHTHMCYSQFNDIIEAIASLDADVITIETSRSDMQLLDAFADFSYPNEIGPGVYDIHSPRLPKVAEMEKLILCAAKVIPVEKLWVNPDCGLKTRSWNEVEPALRDMVHAARNLRKILGDPHSAASINGLPPLANSAASSRR